LPSPRTVSAKLGYVIAGSSGRQGGAVVIDLMTELTQEVKDAGNCPSLILPSART